MSRVLKKGRVAKIKEIKIDGLTAHEWGLGELTQEEAEALEREVTVMGADRIRNRDAGEYVRRRESFTGSNLYGQWRRNELGVYPRYVVSSYGDHYIMFVWENGVWYENVDRYTTTSSKHRTQAHPHEETMPMDTKTMDTLARYGMGGVAVMR